MIRVSNRKRPDKVRTENEENWSSNIILGVSIGSLANPERNGGIGTKCPYQTDLSRSKIDTFPQRKNAKKNCSGMFASKRLVMHYQAKSNGFLKFVTQRNLAPFKSRLAYLQLWIRWWICPCLGDTYQVLGGEAQGCTRITHYCLLAKMKTIARKPIIGHAKFFTDDCINLVFAFSYLHISRVFCKIHISCRINVCTSMRLRGITS